MPNLRWAHHHRSLRTNCQRAGLASAVLAILLCACSGGSRPTSRPVPSPDVVSVSAAACGTGWRHPVAGVQTLHIHNASTSIVEVQLEDPANGAVYAQVEGIGPGTTRSMPANLGSGQYSFSCSGLNYGARIGPVVQFPGRILGGRPVLALTQDQVNSITAQAHAYVADGLAGLVPQTGVLAADIRKAIWRQPGTRG